MAIVRRARVSLDSIDHVLLECKTCKSALSLELRKIAPDTISKCPVCGAPWLFYAYSGVQWPTNAVAGFLFALGVLARGDAPGFPTGDVGCRVLFEFDDSVAQP